MNSFTSSIKALIASSILVAATHAGAASSTTVLDTFEHSSRNQLGIERLFADDTAVGGKTQTQHTVENGILKSTGDITPPRGQPGWASIVFLLQADGKPEDLSQYQGVELRIRVNSGKLSLSANSSEITNFDYHASPIAAPIDGNFHQVKLPFDQMKRVWSEQTELDPQTIASISLIAFDIQASHFDYEIDEISLY